MNILNGINRIKNPVFLFAFLALLFLILPGIAIVFSFNSALFLTLDWGKLVLLASSIVLPFAFTNTLILPTLEKELAKPRPGEFFYALVAGLVMTGLFLYVFLAIAYLWHWTFSYYAKALAGMEFTFIVFAGIKDRWLSPGRK